LAERRFRRALADFVVHYHRERNHQELGNELIDGVGFSLRTAASRAVSELVSPQLLLSGRVVRRPMLSGGIVGRYACTAFWDEQAAAAPSA
jgi:hypothetical protein